MSLPLTARKDIKENEGKRDENMKRICAAVKDTWTFECDFVAFHAVFEKHDKGNKDRMGTFIYGSWLNGLATNIEKLCKDDMSHEAFVEAVKAKKIVFKVDNKVAPGFHPVCQIADGVLNLCVNEAYPTAHIAEAGENIVKIL